VRTAALFGVLVAAPDVDSILARLTLEEQVGQVLFITAGGSRPGAGARLVSKIRPGGITLFRYHLRSPRQIRALTASLRGAAGSVPPLLAVDHEGGAVVRIRRGVPRLPPSAVFGAAGDPALAERAGRAVGAALRDLGFDANLAPVLDVPRAGGGRYLGGRAFGGSADLVARLGAAYVKGLESVGVLAVAKHFPGEGTSRGDPHGTGAVARADGRTLREVDLRPFRAAAPAAVMTGHVAYPRLDPAARPASLSPPVYALLRSEVGHQGPALTDGLEMRSIRARWGPGRAAVAALRAGADMVLLFCSPACVLEARRAILGAVRRGEVSRARLVEAVRRVLAAKARFGLLGGPRPLAPAEPVDALLADLGRAAAKGVRGVVAAPPNAPVLSRDLAVLRAAGTRGVDLRRTPWKKAIARATEAGRAVVAGGPREAALARALARRGVRVTAIVAAPPARARRFPAVNVVAAWEPALLAGALSRVLAPVAATAGGR
jgi:beta-N-acetylhexosaminidase